MSGCEICGQPIPEPIEVRDLGRMIEVRLRAPSYAAAQSRALEAVRDTGYTPLGEVHTTRRSATCPHGYRVQIQIESVL